jgi:hypothetical protein
MFFLRRAGQELGDGRNQMGMSVLSPCRSPISAKRPWRPRVVQRGKPLALSARAWLAEDTTETVGFACRAPFRELVKVYLPTLGASAEVEKFPTLNTEQRVGERLPWSFRVELRGDSNLFL